jgi:3-isopropylmalate/(R)-2-methylmalate dehydratase small subunit
MTPLTCVTSVALPLAIDNIDTDAIIPSAAIKQAGHDHNLLGQGLFQEWHRQPDGRLDPAFPLNMERYEGAQILIGGQNFGCGSSREHAPWAIFEYGFRVVIAGSFGDIFRNNCVKNGILPIALETASLGTVTRDAHECAPGQEMTVDLRRNRIVTAQGNTISFAIPTADREALLNGLDELDQTLRMRDQIAAFMEMRVQAEPWVAVPRRHAR